MLISKCVVYLNITKNKTMRYERKITMLNYSSDDLSKKTDEQLGTEIATCFMVLKELKKEQGQRENNRRFESKLELYKEFI